MKEVEIGDSVEAKSHFLAADYADFGDWFYKNLRKSAQSAAEGW